LNSPIDALADIALADRFMDQRCRHRGRNPLTVELASGPSQ
jgi:hypothetical protein